MKISGAIFDCDGTILDSMPMWFDVFPRWLDAHGVPDARAVCDRYEHMDFEEECVFLAELFGIAETPQAALDEVRELVRQGYRERVRPFPGVGSFLDELASAGVPMMILSSTSEPLVREALAAHGLDGYFSRVLYTGDVGFDKQHAEAYHAVRELLGTPPESTWVFEDAPFGVSTAHGAGYPTVCLFNDHDGRDEAFLRAHSDILAHSWGELSLALLRDYERPFTQGDADGGADEHAGNERGDARPFEVLVVGGSPEASSPELLRRLAATCSYVIAADRGAERLHAAGIAPDVFCGDEDSAREEVVAWARASAQTTIRYPSEKYETDLAIALDCARHEAARHQAPLRLTLSCVSGGRPDHALGVLGNLLTSVDAAPRIVEDAPAAFECRLLSPAGTSSWELGPEALGKTLSVIALAEGTVASEAGLRWELDHATLPLLSDLGVSNRVTTDAACVSCHAGVLAVFLIEPDVSHEDLSNSDEVG